MAGETESIPEADRALYAKEWSKTKKYYDAGKKKHGDGGMFQIIIDPSKCKGYAECVTVCDDNALKMIEKTDDIMTRSRKVHRYFKNIGPSNEKYISDSLLIDMMLKEKTHIYVGGAGSWPVVARDRAADVVLGDRLEVRRSVGPCRRDWLQHGVHLHVSVQPLSGTVDQFAVRERAADALGVRMRWDQLGWQHKPLWCIGGDGAMFDIGFQALSRVRQWHECQGIRAGYPGLLEHRRPGIHREFHRAEHQDVRAWQGSGRQARAAKEIAQIAMMHPRTYVAQTTCAHINHFYKSVLLRV